MIYNPIVVNKNVDNQESNYLNSGVKNKNNQKIIHKAMNYNTSEKSKVNQCYFV